MSQSKWVRPSFQPLEPQLKAAKSVLSPVEYGKYEKMTVDLDRWVNRNNDRRSSKMGVRLKRLLLATK
jgi:hypothetical protein